MIDWKTKLASRKFWLAVIGFVTPILVVFNVPQITVEQIGTIIISGAAVVAYILGESWVDANR